MKYLLFLFLTFYFIACNTVEENNKNQKASDNPTKIEYDTFKTDKELSKIRFVEKIKLEDEEDLDVNSISQSLLINDSILIINSEEYLLFYNSKNGKFLNKIKPDFDRDSFIVNVIEKELEDSSKLFDLDTVSSPIFKNYPRYKIIKICKKGNNLLVSYVISYGLVRPNKMSISKEFILLEVDLNGRLKNIIRIEKYPYLMFYDNNNEDLFLVNEYLDTHLIVKAKISKGEMKTVLKKGIKNPFKPYIYVSLCMMQLGNNTLFSNNKNIYSLENDSIKLFYKTIQVSNDSTSEVIKFHIIKGLDDKARYILYKENCNLKGKFHVKSYLVLYDLIKKEIKHRIQLERVTYNLIVWKNNIYELYRNKEDDVFIKKYKIE